jgi:hypothetical protein
MARTRNVVGSKADCSAAIEEKNLTKVKELINAGNVNEPIQVSRTATTWN